MEAIMIAVSGVAAIAAIAALLSDGWLPGLTFAILSVIAFALSRVLELLGDLFAAIHAQDESSKSRSQQEKTVSPT